jgi:Common central domain of tyrosinase/Polyphenol oxidase middle domain
MSDNNNRRDFLKKSSLLFAGISTTSISLSSLAVSCKNEEKSNGTSSNSKKLAVRKNIADLELNDPELKLFKDAVSILKKRSQTMPLDPMGWDAHGMLHAAFCATSMYSNQVHYNWYVWPWHRLYLWSMEQKLQKAVNEPTLALHYWDWTKNNSIPEVYWGIDNPLNNNTRLVTKEDKIPADFINIGSALRASNYRTFGGYPAIKKRGENQLDGIAEHTFHNSIHNWIGGQMATFTESGFDPIFYGHHGNCDRIWKAWQKYSPQNQLPKDQEWLDKKLYSTDGNGKPVEFKISELLNNENLGYDFHDLNLNPMFCNPFEMENNPQRKTSIADCKAKLNISTTDIYTEFITKERSHIILHFERAQLPYQPYCARIYFEYEWEGKQKSTYTGTFTILPILDLDSVLLQNGVFLQIEVPKEIFLAINVKKNIEVVFQPVPLPNRVIPDVPLKLENITLKTSV